MKNIISLTGLAAILLTSKSFAIERLTPILEPEIKSPVVEEKQSARAWLGVAGQPIDKALATQLGIDHGVTLELVAPDGSAGKAGIKKFDVITKIGDKSINSMNDLRGVLGDSQINDILDVEVFSGGKLVNHKVALDGHPGNFSQSRGGKPQINPLNQRSLSNHQLPQSLGGVSDLDRERIDRIVEAQLQQMEKRFAQMDVRAADLLALQDRALSLSSGSMSSSSVTLMDEQGSIRIKSSDKEGQYVEVKDSQGKVLFAGPYQTEEEKKAAPESVRARIDALGFDSSKGGSGLNSGR